MGMAGQVGGGIILLIPAMTPSIGLRQQGDPYQPLEVLQNCLMSSLVVKLSSLRNIYLYLRDNNLPRTPRGIYGSVR